MAIVDLRDDWSDLLGRRKTFAGALAPYDAIIQAWAAWEPAREAPAWSSERCDDRWRGGRPLIVDVPPQIDAADVEDLMAVAMEAVTAVCPEEAAGMRRLADAWDAGDVAPPSLLPEPGVIAKSVVGRLALRREVAAFVAYAALRPALQSWFAGAHPLVSDAGWPLGICPCCGAPPGFADIIEDGRRRLACHVCGTAWIFSRVRCPLCGADAAGDQTRLEPEGGEAAYFITACVRCGGYVKEIDRRLRWNARNPVVEDWGSPHLDLVARRAGHWRPVPTLVDVVGSAKS